MNTKNINRVEQRESLKLILYGIIVGFAAGGFASGYKYLIHEIEHIIQHLVEFSRTNYYVYGILILLYILIALIVAKLKNYAKFSGGSGIPQVEAEIKGYINPNAFRVLFGKIFGGALAAIAGFSVGREGPSIQMGAMSGKIVSNLLGKNKTVEKFLITCGASAGLAGAFNAPVSGMLFAIEEVHRHINKKLLLVSMSAAITADFISKTIFGVETVFHFQINNALPLSKYWQIVIFGLVLSILGVAYNLLMKLFMTVNDKMKIKEKYKMIPYFLLPIFFFVFVPDLLGSGGLLMSKIQSENYSIMYLCLIFILKLLFSIICFSSGVPGGIFFPILVLGATLGTIFGKTIDPVYINSFIIFGMAGYLTAIVRAPITAIILIFEMTGNVSYLLPLSIVCIVCYAIPNYLNSLPIYEYLLERLIEREEIDEEEASDKMTMSIVVETGSLIDGKMLKEMDTPKGALITYIDRGITEIIPDGNTVLLNGDVINILVREDKLYETFSTLQKFCEN